MHCELSCFTTKAHCIVEKYNNMNMNTGSKIGRLRREAGLTQEQLSEKLSIARSTLACYETGKSQIPNELLVVFAKLFDVTTDYLLGLED